MSAIVRSSLFVHEGSLENQPSIIVGRLCGKGKFLSLEWKSMGVMDAETESSDSVKGDLTKLSNVISCYVVTAWFHFFVFMSNITVTWNVLFLSFCKHISVM